jgi:hypothetical protein
MAKGQEPQRCALVLERRLYDGARREFRFLPDRHEASVAGKPELDYPVEAIAQPGRATVTVEQGAVAPHQCLVGVVRVTDGGPAVLRLVTEIDPLVAIVDETA